MKRPKNKVEELAKVGKNNEEYGYDFVAELAHFTNVDEQRKKVKEMEQIDNKGE